MSYDIVAHICTKQEHIIAGLEFAERRLESTTRAVINKRLPSVGLLTGAPFLLTDKAKGIYAPPAMCIPHHLSTEYGPYLRTMRVEGVLRGEMGWVWHSPADLEEMIRRTKASSALGGYKPQYLMSTLAFLGDCQVFLGDVAPYVPGAGLEMHYF